MNRILKSAILGVAIAATSLSALPAAQAGDHRWRHHRHHGGGGEELAAGLAGLAVGAIVGGALSQPRYVDRVYIDPPAPRYTYRPAPRYYEPAPVYRAPVRYYGAEPWSPEWYRACSARYRSFDPGSGTYLGYDGRRHFCEVG